MRLGISSYTFSWAIGVRGYPPERPMGPIDLLERAAQLGVGVVQVADNLPLHQLTPNELERFEQRAAALGLDLEVGTRGIGVPHLLTYLSLAVRLRSPILRLVIDTPDHHPSEDQIVATLHAVVPELERASVCLAIENHDRFKARDLAELIAHVGSPNVGICLDTANSFGALEGPEVVVAALAPLTVNLHLKDFTVYRPAYSMGFVIEGRPVGEGRLDVPWLLGTLREMGRDPNAILEMWTPPEADLAATIAKQGRWVGASVAYLRRLIPD